MKLEDTPIRAIPNTTLLIGTLDTIIAGFDASSVLPIQSRRVLDAATMTIAATIAWSMSAEDPVSVTSTLITDATWPKALWSV